MVPKWCVFYVDQLSIILWLENRVDLEQTLSDFLLNCFGVFLITFQKEHCVKMAL